MANWPRNADGSLIPGPWNLAPVSKINYLLGASLINSTNSVLFGSTSGPATVTTIVQETVANEETNSNLIEISGAMLDPDTYQLIRKYADLMHLQPEEMDNYPLYQFINQWYGVRYKYGGVSAKGIDCSAFSQKLYGSIFTVNILRTSRQQYRNCDVILDYDDALEGDLVFFRINRIRISHVGVYLNNGYFVHASRSRGVVISSLNDKYWRRRYAGCGHIEREDASNMESEYLQ